MNYCKKCKIQKNESDFSERKSVCTSCYISGRRAYLRAWQIRNPILVKYHNIKTKYGLTQEQYQQMIMKANNKCEICQKECKFCIDHDHKTGKVRGLLCDKCNKGIGYFEDSVKKLNSARQYLMRIGSDEHLMSIIAQSTGV